MRSLMPAARYGPSPDPPHRRHRSCAEGRPRLKCSRVISGREPTSVPSRLLRVGLSRPATGPVLLWCGGGTGRTTPGADPRRRARPQHFRVGRSVRRRCRPLTAGGGPATSVRGVRVPGSSSTPWTPEAPSQVRYQRKRRISSAPRLQPPSQGYVRRPSPSTTLVLTRREPTHDLVAA
jgi:hypothetical protein